MHVSMCACEYVACMCVHVCVHVCECDVCVSVCVHVSMCGCSCMTSHGRYKYNMQSDQMWNSRCSVFIATHNQSVPKRVYLRPSGVHDSCKVGKNGVGCVVVTITEGI